MKKDNPRNSVIIEGLWFLGKTTLAQYYCNRNGYEFVPEPIHISKDTSFEAGGDVDAWYLSEHAKRTEYLNAGHPVVLDRSILASYAFRYASGKQSPDNAALEDFRRSVQTQSALVVYLKSDGFTSPQNVIADEYYAGVKSVFSDEKSCERYGQWFTEKLPYEYGITPFVLRVFEKNVRKTTEQLAEEIRAVLSCDRVAQVNVVCYWQDASDMKILVLKRNSKKGGFWQTITGGVHVGESLEQAAGRELLEETGLTQKSNSRVFSTGKRYSFPGNDGYMLDEYVFAFRVDDMVAVKISEEHDAFEWLSVEEAKKRVAYENNKTAIDSVYMKTGNPSIGKVA
jgi:dATP pyrophosphohydrolase